MGNRKQIKKIAILGSTGMLGYAMARYYKSRGYEVVEINRDQFDVLSNKVADLEGLINRCDFVVNCIGIIKPRIASMKIEDVIIVNGIFPKNLAKLTSKLDMPCFHITTDCVYSGKSGSYTEDSYFDIDDTYGLSKSAGENTDCMTIRTSIIGEEMNNKYSLLEWAKSQNGKDVTGFTNHSWNGVTTLYLSQILEQIFITGKYQKGIFHLFSPTSVTKHELLKIINDAYQLSLRIASAEAPTKVDRTMSSKYQISKEIVTKELKQQISEMHEFFSRDK
jgi:dTDP-4-dehydrorhamnose reductase